MFLGAGEEEKELDGNYVFRCGVMWWRFGQQDAGKELLRATNSVDPDMKALAWAMLAKGARRLRDLERPTPTGSSVPTAGSCAPMLPTVWETLARLSLTSPSIPGTRSRACRKPSYPCASTWSIAEEAVRVRLHGVFQHEHLPEQY